MSGLWPACCCHRMPSTHRSPLPCLMASAVKEAAWCTSFKCPATTCVGALTKCSVIWAALFMAACGALQRVWLLQQHHRQRLAVTLQNCLLHSAQSATWRAAAAAAVATVQHCPWHPAQKRVSLADIFITVISASPASLVPGTTGVPDQAHEPKVVPDCP